MKVAITGASGLLGTALTTALTADGHTVVPVSRTRRDADTVVWNPRKGEIEADKLEGVDAVVHLAGENVFGLRWTQEKKERILASRVAGTELVAKTLAGLEKKPSVLVSASAIGYYGDRGDEILTEASAPAEAGFLSLVCREWERAAQPASDAGIRVVHPRIGVVLSPKGGALELMLPAFKTGLGGRVGPAAQWFSWIALDDVVGALRHALDTDALEGPMNTVAPHPVTMETFTDTLGKVLSRPTIFNVPTGLVRFVGGEMADETILQSARVRPVVLEENGYDFRFPELEEALRHLLGKNDSPATPSPAE